MSKRGRRRCQGRVSAARCKGDQEKQIKKRSEEKKKKEKVDAFFSRSLLIVTLPNRRTTRKSTNSSFLPPAAVPWRWRGRAAEELKNDHHRCCSIVARRCRAKPSS